jgi:hypothetical protein
MTDIYDSRGRPIEQEFDDETALWMAGYEQGVAEGVKMGTALMDQVREAAREVYRWKGSPDTPWHAAITALEALLEAEA